MNTSPSKSTDNHSPVFAGNDYWERVSCGSTAQVYRTPSTTPGRFRATKFISLTGAVPDIHMKAHASEVRALQQLRLKKAEAREKGEVDPGMERVMGLDDPDDYVGLLTDGRLCITTVSRVSD